MNQFALCGTAVLLLSGCAGIEFGPGSDDKRGAVFYDPAPVLEVSVDAECNPASKVTVIPGVKRTIRFRPGLGSSKLTFKLGNGMLTEVNSETSGAVDDVLKIAKGAAGLNLFSRDGTQNPAAKTCTPTIAGFLITDNGTRPVIDATPFYVRRGPDIAPAAPPKKAIELPPALAAAIKAAEGEKPTVLELDKKQ